jgi:hypothetical protein
LRGLREMGMTVLKLSSWSSSIVRLLYHLSQRCSDTDCQWPMKNES